MSKIQDFTYFTLENEALDRNAILVAKHSNIPSYALWRGFDIEQESINSREKWWNEKGRDRYYELNLELWSATSEINNPLLNGRSVEKLINKWIKYFESIKKSYQSEIDSQEKIKTEPKDQEQYCSKRMGNELSCDI